MQLSHPLARTDTHAVGNGSSAGNLDEGVPTQSLAAQAGIQPGNRLQGLSRFVEQAGVAALADRRSVAAAKRPGRSIRSNSSRL